MSYGSLQTSAGPKNTQIIAGHNITRMDRNVLFSSYQFLESVDLSAVPQEDVDYLITKGCMHVPRRPLLDEFISAYFQYVHPFLPLIDEAEFWTLYSPEDGDKECANHISLFVFQAMLFASSAVGLSLHILLSCALTVG